MAQEILDPVKVATDSNIDLTVGVVLDSSESTIDGVTLIVGDRILVKAQTNKIQNGIYVVSNTNVGATTRKALTRATDFAAATSHLASIVFVRRGVLFADTGWIVKNDDAVTVGTTEIEFKRFTVNSLENLSEVTSFLTLREEKGYPLTNAELDNNFKYLGNSLDNKVDNEEYTAESIIDKINSLSYEEAGIDASLLRGKMPSVTVPISTPKPETIVVRDTSGNITTTTFIGDLDGTAFLLRKGTTGRNGDFYTNVNNVDAGILPILHGGTGANTAAQARVNLNVVNKSGDTMTGRLVFRAGQDGFSGNSSLKITPGVALPTITEDGDMWSSGAFLYYKLNNTVQKIAHIDSPIFTGDPKINSVVPNLNSSGNITGDAQLIATIGFVQKLKDEFIDPQLNLKAPIASPTFTSAAYLNYSSIPAVSNSGNILATTQWVQNVKADFLANTIVPTYETIANVALKAPIASPTFTGYAYVNYSGLPGPANNSNILATTQWVQTVRTDLINNTLVPNYATYSYVNSSAPWKGSNKFVSINLPTSSDGVAGDIWIQTTDVLDESELNNSAYVAKDGDAMSGYLTLVGAPTNTNHAATKNYVDTSIGDVASNFIKKDGTVAMTAALTLSGAPTTANHAVSKSYVDTSIANIDVSTTAVMKNTSSVQTMIGKLKTPQTISADDQDVLATKKYVDDAAAAAQAANGGSPIGSIIYYPAATIPFGWMECDGRTLNKNIYTNLFNIIGYTYGGSGNNFNIPDLRGEFIRGWDNGRGVDKNRALGSSQVGTTHLHIMGPGNAGAINAAWSDSLWTFEANTKEDLRKVATTSIPGANGGTVPYSSSSATLLPYKSRPRNVALVACIKVSGEVDDPNQILAFNVITSIDGKLNLTGGTLSGFLTLHATPTSNMHAATKEYVDTKFSQVPTSADVFVNAAGDSMTGHLTLHANPVNAFHAATKTYVDAQIGTKNFFVTYGRNSVYEWTNIVGSFNTNKNYFDVFPPSGYAMTDLKAFIPSIGAIYFAGGVNYDDALLCSYATYADRIRVFVQNTEQRGRPVANWLAIWSKGTIGSVYVEPEPSGEGAGSGGEGGGIEYGGL